MAFVPASWVKEIMNEEWRKIKEQYPNLPYDLYFVLGDTKRKRGIPPSRASSILIASKSAARPAFRLDIYEQLVGESHGSYIWMKAVLRILPYSNLPIYVAHSTTPLPLEARRGRQALSNLFKFFSTFFRSFVASDEEKVKNIVETLTNWDENFLRGFYDGMERVKKPLQEKGLARARKVRARLEKLESRISKEETYNLVIDVEDDRSKEYTFSFVVSFDYREDRFHQEKVAFKIKDYSYVSSMHLSRGLRQLFGVKEKGVSLFLPEKERLEYAQGFYEAGLSAGLYLYTQLEKFLEYSESSARHPEGVDEDAREFEFNKMMFTVAVSVLVRAALQKWLGAQIPPPFMMLKEDSNTSFLLLFYIRNISKALASFPFETISLEVKEPITEEVEIAFTLAFLSAGAYRPKADVVFKPTKRYSYVWSYDTLNLGGKPEEAKENVKEALKSLGRKLFETGFLPEYEMTS